MPEAALFHPVTEQLTPQEMRKVQEEKWQAQWRYVSSQSAFYRGKLGDRCNGAMSLDDLQDVPLTDKEELRQSQEGDYPFGDYVACPKDKVIRLHRTSGTTGGSRGSTIGCVSKYASIPRRQ